MQVYTYCIEHPFAQTKCAFKHLFVKSFDHCLDVSSTPWIVPSARNVLSARFGPIVKGKWSRILIYLNLTGPPVLFIKEAIVQFRVFHWREWAKGISDGCSESTDRSLPEQPVLKIRLSLSLFSIWLRRENYKNVPFIGLIIVNDCCRLALIAWMLCRH